jgi:hypothetical protein
MLKTLAAKHHSTVTKMAALHKAKIETSHGLRTCFEVIKHRKGKKDLVARFGGIPLKQDRRAAIRDPAPVWVPSPRKELLRRLLTRECELCETGATVPGPQPQGTRETRNRPARMGGTHGENATENAYRLRRMS